MTDNKSYEPACPLPISAKNTVQLAHGGGGRLMQELVQNVFVQAFGNPLPDSLHDGATWPVEKGTLAFTTDSYVVRPLFFPGGDIGSLAVNGTINDLAMCGAKPLYLSAAFILEEGLSLDVLQRVVRSMAEAARAAGVPIVTGDTKVVDRGKGDGIFINTAGVGLVPAGVRVLPTLIQPGDAVLVSGDLGSHGVAVLSVREGLTFTSNIESDSAPLHHIVADLLESGIDIHCLRDLTRGGLASVLNELALAAKAGMIVEEIAIPVNEPVRGACELLGLDPLYVANEGRFVAMVPAPQAEAALAVMHRHKTASLAAQIGTVADRDPPMVVLRTVVGTHRVLDLLSGEQLPRIC
ncbi:hydrogenase expression/formation protein HypE [Candidatus Nitrospira nitrificans]|uniref:Hydrogenase expression/formation protein HypE n=1 Tax=Candidatus Nitrospira nitrificans TaxID=1742973 RepID=A0A0S4LET0_9BACT|nr:hydrogenase expression/formation protein HypE [Candidatus Nitrospira nitrificans]CUS35165.1 Hydrogenase expression/formation protein HypE [Candidatus Nitrospira nitrificans]